MPRTSAQHVAGRTLTNQLDFEAALAIRCWVQHDSKRPACDVLHPRVVELS